MRHNITQIFSHEHGGTYKVTLEIPWEKGFITNVRFYVRRFERLETYQMQFERNENNYAYFETVVNLWECPMYQYYFSFYGNDGFQYYKKENRTGNSNVNGEECFELAVNYSVAEWAKGAVGYQIFPDRFSKGKNSTKCPMPRRHLHENWDELPVLGPDEEGIHNNDFFGGDFAGIKEKIPYLVDLGIEVLYLNPIVRSQSTHRYDAADYFQPDPYLGTVEELKDLTDELHKNGIKVVFDGVFNHTGNDSVYYDQYGTYGSNGAYNNPESPYREIYEWDENGKAHGWWNFDNMPTCDKNSHKFRDMIFGVGGVIDVWCSWGMDGLRLDVADNLTDDFIAEINKAMTRNRPEGFIIYLEVWEDAMRKDNKTYISNANEGHTTMNYYFTDYLLRYYKYGDIGRLYHTFEVIRTDYPTGTRQTLMNSTGTHDKSRLINVLVDNVFMYNGDHTWDIDFDKDWNQLSDEERRKWLENSDWDAGEAFGRFKEEWQRNYKLTQEEIEHGKKVSKSYVTALAFMPGMFTVYYGDEVGMHGIGNLLSRGTYPWGHEDTELFEFYKRLIKSRKSEKFLRKADVRILRIDENQFVYERFDDNNKIIVITSRVNNETEVLLPEEYKNAEVVFAIEGSNKNTLAPYGAIVLKK